MTEVHGRGNGMDSFKQQDLKAWQPVLTPVAVIAVLLSVAIVFMPIGIILRDASTNVIEYRKRYDNIDSCYVDSDMNYTVLPKNCSVTFTIEENMDAPVYFYYELENFYQNHRRYLKSKSDDQLRGEGNNKVSDCSPLKKNDGLALVACGLVSASFFEDRFNMYVNGESLCNDSCINYGINNTEAWYEHWDEWYSEPNWSMDGIAWESDEDDKFKFVALDTDKQTRIGPRQEVSGLRLPDVNNSDFIVWMRVAALPNFRKLHRIISEKDLKKGDEISVEILSWFPVDEFDGKKYVVLTTTEWCGGENFSLAWTYIIVSTIAIGLAVLFAVLLLFGSRKMGDVDLFEWSNRPKSSSLVHIS